MGFAEGTALIFITTFNSFFLSMWSVFLDEGTTGAWLVPVIGAGCFLILFMILLYVIQRVPGDLHQIAEVLLGKTGARLMTTYVGVNPKTGEDKPAGEKLPNERFDGYLPTDIPRTGTENPIEFVGTAIFSGDKMVGVLDSRATRILAILDNNFARSIFNIAAPLEPQKYISVSMRNGSKPNIDVQIIDGQEVIKIDVFLEGELMNIPSGINYEKQGYREQLEAELADLVTQQIQVFMRDTQALGSDVFAFGHYLRRHVATYSALREINSAQLYKTAKVEVRVTSKLRRVGLMWRSSPYAPTATFE